VAPTSATSINKPVWIATSNNTAIVTNMRGIQNVAPGSGGGGSNASGVSTSNTITYTNTFSAGNVISRVLSGYALALADTSSDAEVIGVVQYATPTQFTVVYSGLIGGLTGLSDSSVYFLSDTVPGSATLTPPTAVTSISKPVFVAVGATSAIVINQRGIANQSSGFIISGNTLGVGGNLSASNNVYGTNLYASSTVYANTISATNIYTLNEYNTSAYNFTTVGTTELSGTTSVVGSLYINGVSAVPTNRNAGIALIFGR